jgi:hypothetical protein
MGWLKYNLIWFFSVICASGSGSASTSAGGRFWGVEVGVADVSEGVAEGSEGVAVGVGVFLLHPETNQVKLIMIRMEINISEIEDLLCIPRD